MSITKAEQYILNHLSPVEYGLYCDTYLCGVSVENKDRYIYSIRDRVKEWVEKNGGRFIVLSEKKVISHVLNKKGIVVQIYFPIFGKRDMKNIMATLYDKDMQRVKIFKEGE